MAGNYDPTTHKMLCFSDHVPAFLNGSSSPRKFLEQCLETIEAREPTVKAWVALRIAGARADADASTARYAAGKPLSPIDGIPLGIKDTLPTADLPTGWGILGNTGNVAPDTASVVAAKAAGAVILGKVSTAELGGVDPALTTNPFDPQRSPGGSSAGSGAAVGAGMVPAALGTQVGGSIMRPAAFCGNFALKPTQGGIHRGDRLGLSQATIGVHAGSLVDMWRVAIEIANRAGGDPGYPGIIGEPELPAPVKPKSLIVMEGPGWSKMDPRAMSLFEATLESLSRSGIKILRRTDDKRIEQFESLLHIPFEITGRLVAYENRWIIGVFLSTLKPLVRQGTLKGYETGRSMTRQEYRKLLELREQICAAHRGIAGLADALIAPSCLGPAPPFTQTYNLDAGDQPTGNWVQNAPSSALLAPAVNLPLLAVDGMPVGVQLLGQMHDDQRMTAIGRWVMANTSVLSG